MGIKHDAGEVLVYIYHQYENDAEVNVDGLFEQFPEWDSKRIDRALKYLKELNLVKITLMCGNKNGLQNFVFSKLTPEGINAIEDKPEFQRNFNCEVNLLFAKFGWGVQER
jgi:hypothetical protein